MTPKPKIICITGGKGGTGKTLVAVNLAVMFNNEKYKVLLIDGDVENPNTYLLMGGALENQDSVPFFMPRIVEENCTKCGLCAENCVPHALLHIKDAVPIPILTVCSGCKLCYKICPADAIAEDYKTIGWTYSSSVNGLDYFVGELKPGEARSAAVVDDLLDKLDNIIEKELERYDVIVMDTAPGAHCDVELLIEKADIVIPVTEPTKFGKLDLIRIIELIDLLGKEYKAIVNRSSLLGFKEEFLKELEENKIEILGDIPMDDEVVKSYCQGKPLMDNHNEFDKNGEAYKAFTTIFKNLTKWLDEIKQREGED
ncbi:MAG: nucleotide-binding protein [Promethearchaeota archaeon]